MTAVANPPSFANINRPAWGVNGSSSLHAMNPDESRGVFTPRKALQRTNSASSVSSTTSTSSTGTVVNGHTNGASSTTNGDWNRKKPQTKGQWSQQPQPVKPDGVEFSRTPVNRPPPNAVNGNGAMHQQSIVNGAQSQAAQQNTMARPMADPMNMAQPVLYLLSLNGTFERKTISVPFFPETLRIGRQTNARTVPTSVNGYFDSKVLSRQHAEIYADRTGKIWIRDIKSSNGTFVNGTRLSQENRESEPHELQTQDHLELGIDIVNEDQKSVVHHKVAAKVEHAGFLNPSHSLMDMSFADIDPSAGQMMMQQQMGNVPGRGRTGSQPALNNGRMPPAGMPGAQPNGILQRNGMWMSQPSTEAIVKKLHQEMRIAMLQANDLKRTAHFLDALTGKDEVKVPDPNEASEAPKQHSVNGSASKPGRFSDPPAPPPQLPLPEKPEAGRPNGDTPSLKRGITERAKITTTLPAGPDNISQIIQLTETLNNAKKEIEGQSARIRDLEEMVQKEREQRESAEGLVKKLEDAVVVSQSNETEKIESQETLLAEAFELPAEAMKEDSEIDEAPSTREIADAAAAEVASKLQARMDLLMKDMMDLRDELETQRRRAEKAEAERDGDRQTLAEMILRIRERDEEIQRLSAAKKERSRSSRSRGRSGSRCSFESNHKPGIGSFPATPVSATMPGSARQLEGTRSDESGAARDDTNIPGGQPTLSRANTITPMSKSPVHSSSGAPKDTAVAQAAPYASMIGVVLIGMGLMAWINGWQPQPRLDR